MTQIKGLLVDVDGTLVDTNDMHVQAWVEALASCGRTVTFAQVRPLIGMGADQLLPRLIGVEKESDEGKRIADAWSRIFRERYLPEARPFPQAAELLKRVHDRGIRIVAASSGEEEIADALLARAGAEPYLQDRTTSADAKRSKPAPDIVAAALHRCGLPATEVLLLGDAPYDIEASRPVGVAVIALRSGGFPDDALSDAIAIYNDPADLLAHFDTSPLGQPT